jgi:hypothetical protein
MCGVPGVPGTNRTPVQGVFVFTRERQPKATAYALRLRWRKDL